MSIYPALRAFLLADATIAAAIGNRIYPVKAPQGARYPLITIQRVSGVRASKLRGAATAASPRFQIDCWAKEASGVAAYQQSQDLGAAVLARLEGYVGPMTDARTSPPAVFATSVTFEDDRELYEADVNGGYHRLSADYVVWHQAQGITT